MEISNGFPFAGYVASYDRRRWRKTRYIYESTILCSNLLCVIRRAIIRPGYLEIDGRNDAAVLVVVVVLVLNYIAVGGCNQ